MNIFFLKRSVARLMKPVDDGSAGGGAVDRGDTLAAGAPAVDDEAKAAAEAAENARIAAEAAAGKQAEGEGEGEGDPDAVEGETEAQAAERKAAKGKMIPVERHSAILAKAREERDAAVAALAAQAKGREVANTNADIAKIETDVIEKEKAYNEALVAGETEKASALMREIRSMERQMGDLKADMKAQIATANAVESVRYDTAVERLEAAYPVLNPDHEDFDKDKTAEVLDLQDAYKLRGMSPTAALQKAVKILLGAETTKQTTATTVTPRVDTAAVAAQRKEAATKANIDAANKTPPNPAKVGIDSDKLGGGQVTADMVMKMGQEQFKKLDEATLARLRGDDI